MSDLLPDIGHSRSVLFVLEDVTVAHAFARIAESRGHVCAVASSVEECLTTAPPDVLVAELGGPRCEADHVDGPALVETMRTLGHDPHTVLIASADAPGEAYDQAVAMGIDQIVERPLLPDAMLRAIEAERPGDRRESCEELRILVEAGGHAAEDAARELVAWCVRCEVVPAARARIGTAVAEAVENAALHGSREVEITAIMTPGQIKVDVVDDGPGFDAVEVLTSGVLDGNSGLGRIHSLSDEVQVSSTLHRGTHVALTFSVRAVEFDDEHNIDLTDLDFFIPATSRELLATLSEEPDAPVILSPALAVVVGRLLMGPSPSRVLEGALRTQHG